MIQCTGWNQILKYIFKPWLAHNYIYHKNQNRLHLTQHRYIYPLLSAQGQRLRQTGRRHQAMNTSVVNLESSIEKQHAINPHYMRSQADLCKWDKENVHSSDDQSFISRTQQHTHYIKRPPKVISILLHRCFLVALRYETDHYSQSYVQRYRRKLC